MVATLVHSKKLHVALVLLAAMVSLTFSYVWMTPVAEAPASCTWNARPLTCLSFHVGPAEWHGIENLALHWINSALALWIFAATMPLAAATVATALFALHPIQAEAVSMAAGRGELLAALFALLATQAWRGRNHWLSAGWFALSLASGPAAVALPLFLGLIEVSWGARRQGGTRALVTMAMLSAASLVALTITEPVPGGGLLNRLLSAGPVLGRYARMLVLPANFSIWPEVDQSAMARFAAWMLLALFTGAALSAFGRLRLGFWFLASLLLIAPSFLLFDGPEAAADRHLYLPMLAIAAVAGRVLESTQFPKLLGAGVMLLGALTYGRAAVWQSEQAMWEEAAQEAPRQLRPRLELARMAPPHRALEMLLETRQMYPNDPRVAAQLGGLYLGLHLPSAAVEEFTRALAARPGDAEPHLARGHALAELGLREAALTDYETALAINPCLPAARVALNLPPLAECHQK